MLRMHTFIKKSECVLAKTIYIYIPCKTFEQVEKDKNG
jgi:hypothetical protein